MTDSARENVKFAADVEGARQQEQERLRRVAAAEHEGEQRAREANTAREIRSEILDTKKEVAKGRSLGRLRAKHYELTGATGEG